MQPGLLLPLLALLAVSHPPSTPMLTPCCMLLQASQYELDYLAARNDMGLEDNNQAVAPAAALVGAEADAEVPAVQPETAGAVPQRLAGQKRALSAELPALPAAAAMGGDSNSSNPAGALVTCCQQ